MKQKYLGGPGAPPKHDLVSCRKRGRPRERNHGIPAGQGELAAGMMDRFTGRPHSRRPTTYGAPDGVGDLKGVGVPQRVTRRCGANRLTPGPGPPIAEGREEIEGGAT
jgi:hypothetical protein